MWKYISRVLKVIEEEKKVKNPKAACDSKEYEKNSTRRFLVKWQVSWPLLQHDRDGVEVGGVNFWASENESGQEHFEGYSQMGSTLKIKCPTL